MVAASSAGHFGAASATWEHVHRHFAVAALFVARNAAYPSGGPKIDSHVDFDSTAAWRHHVSMPPSSRSQSAATTALTAGICELFRVKRLREIPHWRILGRCLPPTTGPARRPTVTRPRLLQPATGRRRQARGISAHSGGFCGAAHPLLELGPGMLRRALAPAPLLHATACLTRRHP